MWLKDLVVGTENLTRCLTLRLPKNQVRSCLDTVGKPAYAHVIFAGSGTAWGVVLWRSDRYCSGALVVIPSRCISRGLEVSRNSISCRCYCSDRCGVHAATSVPIARYSCRPRRGPRLQRSIEQRRHSPATTSRR